MLEESPNYWYNAQEFIKIFCLQFKYQIICWEISYQKRKWHTFVFHGIQQFIHNIMNNGFLWWFIVCNMVVRFAFSSVGKKAWLKSTVRRNALLFDWRSFSAEACSCKGKNYGSNSLCTLPSFWLSNCFLHWWLSTSSSRTYILLHICEFFALHIQFFWHLPLGDILNCCWAFVTFFFVRFGLHVYHVRLMGTTCITSEDISFEIVIIHFDYWRFYICYATRTGFWSLSISQSPNDVEKEEIVVINAYHASVQYVN